jgi:hypothetical protein
VPIHDIRCTECADLQTDVFVRVGELPPCDVCGMPMKIDWGHGHAPSVRGHGYGSFTPIDMGVLGKAETKEDYDRAVATVQQRFPGHRIELESESASQKQARVDALRHASYERKRARGEDEKMIREAAQEHSAKKAEKAAQGLPPAPAPVAPAAS